MKRLKEAAIIVLAYVVILLFPGAIEAVANYLGAL